MPDALSGLKQANPLEPSNPPKRRAVELRKRSTRLAGDAKRSARDADYSRAAYWAWRAAEALIIARAVQQAQDPADEALRVAAAHRLIHVLRRQHLRRAATNGWFGIYGRYVPPRPDAPAGGTEILT